MILYGFTLILLVFYVIIILYYRWAWQRIPSSNPSFQKSTSQVQLMVTVVIIARNEERNMGKCLSSLGRQTYSKNSFEIIVVDDHSTDGTVAVVNSFQEKNIRLLKLSDHTGISTINSYKKFGITKAIEVANGELIMTTDADCVVPPHWLDTFVSFYQSSNPVFIASSVVYDNISGKSVLKKMFQIFQSLDFIMLQGITAASVNSKVHNMCNGANLAYTKAVFIEVGGFGGIDDLASGDDMLLMHKIAKIYPHRIGFLKSKDTIVITQAAENLVEFFHQRIRWASKADRFPDKKITGVLILVYIFNVSIFLAGMCSFFSSSAFYIFVISFIVKILAEMVLLFPVARFFNRQQLIWYFIPLQPFHIIYTIVAGWLGKFGSYRWKERKVN